MKEICLAYSALTAIISAMKTKKFCHNNCNGGQVQRQGKINCVFESEPKLGIVIH